MMVFSSKGDIFQIIFSLENGKPKPNVSFAVVCVFSSTLSFSYDKSQFVFTI